MKSPYQLKLWIKENMKLKTRVKLLQKQKKDVNLRVSSLEEIVQEKENHIKSIHERLKIMNEEVGSRIGNFFGDKRGLGFEEELKPPNSKATVFVKASSSSSPMKNTLTQFQAKRTPHHTFFKEQGKFIKPFSQFPKFIPLCHFCGVKGHIRPRCYNYIEMCKFEMNENRNMNVRKMKHAHKTSKKLDHQKSINMGDKKKKRFWVRKDELYCHVAQYPLKAFTYNSWYFDSGCSRHMTCDKIFFKTFASKDGGSVTFGDGKKCKVLGKYKVELPRLPSLDDVLLVDGLKANLISISHLCGSGFSVHFVKDKCLVVDTNDKLVLRVNRSNDNCYCVDFENIKCNLHESLGGKNYILACVDDYSRFTWVAFLREKQKLLKNSNYCASDENKSEIGDSSKIPPPWVQKAHDKDDLIGNLHSGVKTKRQVANQISYVSKL
ncbi:hypothetical protein UlMin_014002 [Ulmus minor]